MLDKRCERLLLKYLGATGWLDVEAGGLGLLGDSTRTSRNAAQTVHMDASRFCVRLALRPRLRAGQPKRSRKGSRQAAAAAARKGRRDPEAQDVGA